MHLFKLFAAIVFIIFMLCFVSCDMNEIKQDNTFSDGISEQTTTEQKTEKNGEEMAKNSETVKKDNDDESLIYPYEKKLSALLSELGYWDPDNDMFGGYAVGLFDINFDGIPELLEAHRGGSMGNAFIEVYDIETGKAITSFDHSVFYGDFSPFYACKSKSDERLFTVFEGCFRDPPDGVIEWVMCYDKDWNVTASFSVLNDNYRYLGEIVTKEEYEIKYKEFFDSIDRIEGSDLQMVDWSEMKVDNDDVLYSKMARALFGSTQVFVRDAEYLLEPYQLKVYALLKQLEYWDPANNLLGVYAVGLLDINFDGIPELLAVYPGGSMGNSVVKVYDVETEKIIDEFNHSAALPFYVSKDKTSGEYLTVSEGTVRVPYFDFFKWINCRNKDWELVASFSVEGDMYRCFNKEITKEEYESKYQEFFGNLEIGEGSNLQIISYDSIQANSVDELYWEMSKALFSSTQVFVKNSEQKMD